jgi:hypothetical protein
MTPLESGARAEGDWELSSTRYAADDNEIKTLGGDDITTPSTRTPDQTEIGFSWLESSPLAWNRLARAVSVSQGFDLWDNARLFGLLNLAMADGYIGSWETKYHYNFWRPITAIRMGDTDGNPDTEAVLDWTPLQWTYPVADHDSGHAVQGGVAAEASDSLLLELLSGRRRECLVTHLRRQPLPTRR